MLNAGSLALATGALFSISAAVAHLACVAAGPQAYRFMGAGEKMARAAESGSIRPAVITLLIAGVLFMWGAYALSGAGIIRELPFTKPALVSICTAYLLRAVAFPALRPAFPENSDTFWLVSSSICLVAGLVHALGMLLRWHAL